MLSRIRPIKLAKKSRGIFWPIKCLKFWRGAEIFYRFGSSWQNLTWDGWLWRGNTIFVLLVNNSQITQVAVRSWWIPSLSPVQESLNLEVICSWKRSNCSWMSVLLLNSFLNPTKPRLRHPDRVPQMTRLDPRPSSSKSLFSVPN